MPTTHLLIAKPSASGPGTAGVDMQSNPMTITGIKLASAVNVRFDEGMIRTRPAFVYHKLRLSGQFQGALHYSPSRGLSARSFADKHTALVVAIRGRVFVLDATIGRLSCAPIELRGSHDFCNRGPVHMFQAENWLIVQNRQSNTFFWEGQGSLIASPGMAPCPTEPAAGCPTQKPGETGFPGGGVPGTSLIPQFPRSPTASPGCTGPNPVPVQGAPECLTIPDSTHDSFCSDRHANWLINAAGLGIFAHGRIHQEGDGEILVGDLIHKRGPLATDDVLKMEEQALDSMGDPLTVRSSMGDLLAMEVLPSMSTSIGEGELIAYYEHGVVAFDTFQSPRQTRMTAEGEIVQQGWSMKKLVSPLLNTVSAVGRLAVALMPRDHFFRSVFGLHFLRTTMGDGTFNPEFTNLVSQDIKPILDTDPEEALNGAATGVWVRHHRLFATTGLYRNEDLSPIGVGRGFVSINLASGFSEDRTPKFLTEGVWVPDHPIGGIHQFVSLGLRPQRGAFGFLASDRDGDLYFAEINPDIEEDYRDEDNVPIEWSVVTGRKSWSTTRQRISEGALTLEASSRTQEIRVSICTDAHPEWRIWETFQPCKSESCERVLITHPLGVPPAACREALWVQVRVEGLGFACIHELSIQTENSSSITGQKRCVAIPSCVDDPFISNSQPVSSRWASL